MRSIRTEPTRITMRPGDIARMPAGLPHSFTPGGSAAPMIAAVRT